MQRAVAAYGRGAWSEAETLCRRELARNRLTKPLFDTRLFTRHIEEAYARMHERYVAGLPPEHIHVSP